VLAKWGVFGRASQQNGIAVDKLADKNIVGLKNAPGGNRTTVSANFLIGIGGVGKLRIIVSCYRLMAASANDRLFSPLLLSWNDAGFLHGSSGSWMLKMESEDELGMAAIS